MYDVKVEVEYYDVNIEIYLYRTETIEIWSHMIEYLNIWVYLLAL